MISSITIRNFRCFKNLTLHDLKRVTLIVGENNSGKTSLLEALFLLLGANNPEISLRLNAWRGIQQYASNWEETWGWLFYGKQTAATIELFAQNETKFEQGVSIKLTPPREFEVSVRGQSDLPLATGRPGNETGKPVKFGVELSDLILDYHDSGGQKVTTRAMFTPDGSVRIEQAKIAGLRRGAFVHTHARNLKEDADQFSKLKAAGRDAEVVAALANVEKRLRALDILVIGGEPVVHAHLNGLPTPVPLPMMGEGFNRIFAIVLRIANFPNGVVLIDEIENGLHVSALEKLWSAVHDMAAKTDVQVFATTHSLECVRAALVTSSSSNQDGICVQRTQKVNGTVEAVALKQDALAYAVENNLEIRQ
jgi:predicted ATPase